MSSPASSITAQHTHQQQQQQQHQQQQQQPQNENSKEDILTARARLKSELKTWEKMFEKTHARRPSRKDIAAGHGIALKYSQYADLRKGVMPASLLDPNQMPSPPPVHVRGSAAAAEPKKSATKRKRRRGHGFAPCSLGTFAPPKEMETTMTAQQRQQQLRQLQQQKHQSKPKGGTSSASSNSSKLKKAGGEHKGSWNARSALASRRSRPLSVKLGVGEGLAFVAAGMKRRSRLASLSANRKAPEQQEQRQQLLQQQPAQQRQPSEQKSRQEGQKKPFSFGSRVQAGKRWDDSTATVTTAAAPDGPAPAPLLPQFASADAGREWAIPAPSPNVFAIKAASATETQDDKSTSGQQGRRKKEEDGNVDGGSDSNGESDSDNVGAGGHVKKARKGKHMVSRNFVRTDMRRKKYRSKKRGRSARDERGNLKASRGFRTDAQRRKSKAEQANERLYSDLMTPEELARAVREEAQERHKRDKDETPVATARAVANKKAAKAAIRSGTLVDGDSSQEEGSEVGADHDDDDTSDEDVKQLRQWEAQREKQAAQRRMQQDQAKRLRAEEEQAKQRRVEAAIADIPAWCLDQEHDIAVPTGAQQEQTAQAASDAAAAAAAAAAAVTDGGPKPTEKGDAPPRPVVQCDARSVLHNVFGFAGFRPGQEEAITRVLGGESILLLLRTGGGKSLCYQLPAAVFPGVTLVVTPLISLMRDQLARLPAALPGGFWNSQQTRAEVVGVMRAIRDGKLKVLFVSPEKLLSPGFQRFMCSLPSPGVSFACVDEAHCVSEWSHNFRPAYLRLSRVLRETLRVRCILALTATATAETERTVCRSLGIEHPRQVVRCPPTRRNLQLSVSREHDRDAALLGLLQTPRFQPLGSIIVYVMRQREADTVAAMLRTKGLQATSYHAGKSKQTRNKIQERFMAGRLRLVVATIAFGMGLDKSDVRAVIHYSMPRTLEHYVQEVGRAGRDGLPAFCHAFYASEDCERMTDLCLQDCVDRDSIKQLVKRVFLRDPEMSERKLKEAETAAAKGKKKSKRKRITSADDDGHDNDGDGLFVAAGGIVPLDLQDLEVDLDLDQAMAGTLLSQLELGTHQGRRLIQIVAKLHNSATIGFHRSDPFKLGQQLGVAAEILRQNGVSSPADMATRGAGKKGRNGQFALDVCVAATYLRVHVADVQRDLIKLKANKEISIQWRDRCFALRVEDPVQSLEELEAVVDSLDDKMQRQEQCQLRKIETVSRALQLVSKDSFRESLSDDDDDDEEEESDGQGEQQGAGNEDNAESDLQDPDNSNLNEKDTGKRAKEEDEGKATAESHANVSSAKDSKPSKGTDPKSSDDDAPCVDLHSVIARYFRAKDEAELLDELEAADKRSRGGRRAREDRRAALGRKSSYSGRKGGGAGRGRWGRGSGRGGRQSTRGRYSSGQAVRGSWGKDKRVKPTGKSIGDSTPRSEQQGDVSDADGQDMSDDAEEEEGGDSSAIDMTVDGDDDDGRGSDAAKDSDHDQEVEPQGTSGGKGPLSAFPWLRGDVMSFLARFGPKMRSGRDVARVLRGDHTPKFPRSKWKTCGAWGKYKQVPLPALRPFCEDCFAVFRAAKAKRGSGDKKRKR